MARAWALEACGRIWSVGGLGRLAGPPRSSGPGQQRPVARSSRPSAWGLAPTATASMAPPVSFGRPAAWDGRICRPRGLLVLLGGRCRGTGGHRPDLTGTWLGTAGRRRPAAGAATKRRWPARGLAGRALADLPLRQSDLASRMSVAGWLLAVAVCTRSPVRRTRFLSENSARRISSGQWRWYSQCHLPS